MPEGKKGLSTRWIFKWKQDPLDERKRFEKARLVVRGYEQIPGVDFTETFSPVASDAAIRTVLAITLFYASKHPSWKIDIVDVETAFLNAPLSEDIYVKVPEGYDKYTNLSTKTNEVLKLNRALYGLVQSPRAWLKHFVSILKKCGMTVCQSEPCVMYKREGVNLVLMVVIYVDDCIIAGRSTEVEKLKRELQKHIVISDLGQLKKHLGVHYKFGKDAGGPYLEAGMMEFAQEIATDAMKYCAKLVENYPSAGKFVGTLRTFPTPGYFNEHPQLNKKEAVMNEEYRSIIGKILYLVKKVEPNCANAVRELSSFLDNPSIEHWKHVRRLAGYIYKYSRPLKMRAPKDLRVIGCVDSDWANDRIDRKSIGGYLITIGNCLVDWSSKKQATVALSSTEAEYMAYSDAATSIKYIQTLTEEITGIQIFPSVLFEDNTGAIHLLNNDHIGKRTKHIDIRYRFVNDLIKQGKLIAKFRRSADNTADILTKHVSEKLFRKHAGSIYEGQIFSQEELAEANRKEEVHALKRPCGCMANKEDVGKIIQATHSSRMKNILITKESGSNSGQQKLKPGILKKTNSTSEPTETRKISLVLRKPIQNISSNDKYIKDDLKQLSNGSSEEGHGGVPKGNGGRPNQWELGDLRQDPKGPKYLPKQPPQDSDGWTLVQRRRRRKGT